MARLIHMRKAAVASGQATEMAVGESESRGQRRKRLSNLIRFPRQEASGLLAAGAVGAVAAPSRSEPAVTVARKAEHIRINLEEDVAAKGITSGFENYRFIHRALPEIDLDQVDISTELFGHRLKAPLLISCMTGGVPEAKQINRTLAEVAQELGLALGLGSGRALLERPEVLPTFTVRPYAPDILLFANLGAVQLNRGIGVEQCRRLLDLIGADALVLHLNALQEALQPEGDTCFGGLLEKIADLCHHLDAPVIVKEVGWGIAPDVVLMLLEAGVAAVDVAGAGGTSWSEVERHRVGSAVRARVAATFADWGLPTAEAVKEARRVAPSATIFASGGVRSGMDVAKAIALGADLVGTAGPFLRAAAQGTEAVLELAEEYTDVLRTTMFCIGTPNLNALQGTSRLVCRTPASTTTFKRSLSYATAGAGDFVDITNDVATVVKSSGVRNGLVLISSQHTTAAIRINENEPLLLGDFRRLLNRLAPVGGYEHDDMTRRCDVPTDEPRNGHAHCQQLLLASSESVPVVNGQLDLGRWQRVFLIELDSPRQRQVTVQVLGH
jgi:isopentenyl-diphosphate delta-isomerase